MLLGCSGPAPTSDREPVATAPPSVTDPPSPSPTPSPDPEPGTVPPEWLFTRPLPISASGLGEVQPTPPELAHRRFTLPDSLPALPGDGFASQVERAPEAVLARSTWRSDCPVGADELDWVRLTFRGFDGERHTGELLVNSRVSADVVQVFGELWDADFPLEEMRVTEARELDLEPTGDGNNTGSFVCRPSQGGERPSEHALGLAVDVNPFQNPYRKGDVVIPELASAYLDRVDERAGMVLPGGPVVEAFDRVGWGWGGAWRTLTDPMHFSLNGR